MKTVYQRLRLRKWENDSPKKHRFSRWTLIVFCLVALFNIVSFFTPAHSLVAQANVLPVKNQRNIQMASLANGPCDQNDIGCAMGIAMTCNPAFQSPTSQNSIQDRPTSIPTTLCAEFKAEQVQVTTVPCIKTDGTEDIPCYDRLTAICSDTKNTVYPMMQELCTLLSKMGNPHQSTCQTDSCVTDTSNGNSTATGNNYQAPTTKDPTSKVENIFGEKSALFYSTPGNATFGNDEIKALWKLSLLIVDICMVVIIMLNGLKLMWAGSVFRYSNAVESLPGVLLAYVCAHISILFITLFLVLNNTLSAGIITAVTNGNYQRTKAVANGQPVTAQGQSQCDSAGNPFLVFLCYTGAGEDPNDVADLTIKPQVKIQDFSIVPNDLNIPNFWTALGSLWNLLEALINILGITLLAQMIIRLFLIDFYIVTAPIGIAAWALPGRSGEQLTRMWFQGFISTVMVQFVQVMGMVVAQLMLGAIAGFVAGNVDPKLLSTDSLRDIIHIILLFFIIRIPGLLGTAPLRMMIETGQAIQQTTATMVAVELAKAQVLLNVGTSVGTGLAARALGA